MTPVVRRFQRVRLTGLAFVLLVLPLCQRSLQAQGPNLLQNPGFERPYLALPNKENCRIAVPWVAYWYEGSPDEVKEGYRLAPEYKAAFREDYPGNRVRSGELSQQYFHSFGNFQGGVYQQVPNIPVGSRLRFEMWGMTWSCDNEKKSNCAKATSGDPSPMRFRIGIDPTGGVDALSPSIVWSAEQNAYDDWHLFQIEAIAQNAVVTVFVYAYPEYRSQDNNVYIDDASLVIVAPPPTPTRPPTNTPTNTPIPTDTPTPTETPLPSATPTETPTPTPTSTDTLTPVPTDTATPLPTTAVPSATPAPTDTPLPMPSETPLPPAAATRAELTSWPFWLLVGLAGIVAALMVGILIGRRQKLEG